LIALVLGLALPRLALAGLFVALLAFVLTPVVRIALRICALRGLVLSLLLLCHAFLLEARLRRRR
jgi:hypothetical protein